MYTIFNLGKKNTS